jgi:3-oxoacyl-[acyl-carrier-protein] synthase I
MRGQAGEISITALGMATALAPSMADSCAAFRAGVRRTSEISTVDPTEDEALGGEPIAACRAAYLAEGYCSAAKVILLGSIALSDLFERRSLTDGERARMGIVVHLSDCFLLDKVSGLEEIDEEDVMPSVLWREESASLVSRMLTRSRLPIPENSQYRTFGGHAGFVDALQAGAELIAAGRLDCCLVGAVDSCLDPEFLLAAAVNGWLKTPENPVGFIPGEAAAFVLLERTADARRSGILPLASVVCGPVIPGKRDRFSEEPPDGVDLARAILDLVATQPGRTEIGLVIGDLNGDEYRARSWGSAIIRLGDAFAVADAPMWIPALGFGETGSAAGAVGLCLAVRAMERGHIGRGTGLVWLCDESGAGSVLMLKAGAEGPRGANGPH